MKKNLRTMTGIFLWGMMLLAGGLVITTLTACGRDDDPAANGIDDLAYLKQRIAADGSLVYGVQLGTDTKDIVNRPVATVAEAQAEFYKLLSGGSAHQGLSTTADGTITCCLTAADGKPQGTITYRASQSETIYYCAEVTFSTEVRSATGISYLRYILYDRWPEDGNGFMKDILDGLKK
ncbi:MAG: hypothetical protein IKH59_07145 [Bacteroidaceae bacterium]|nr:hypothetical protein [Bacteroidaceae bacterium]